MRKLFPFLFLITYFLSPAALLAQSQTPLQASNILNPNISVIGWFQGEAGHHHASTADEDPPAFEFKEVEIAFQSIVDAYAKADIFVALEGEGEVEIEEGYLTWFRLPAGLQIRLGKMKANIGQFNRIHTPETEFADRPLVHDAYFGEEGLGSTGGALSWHIPNPWLFVNLDLEAFSMPDAEETPAFDEADQNDLLYVGRLGTYLDLTPAANVSLGGSVAHGAAGQEFNAATNSSTTLTSQIYGADVTIRWKNPRRAIYRSFLWRTEILWNRRELDTINTLASMGLFSHVEHQFARRWRAGARYDWTESPTNKTDHDQGGLIYLTFSPSEFNRISLQTRRVKKPDGKNETLGWLKVTFNIGPHGSHPF